MAHYYDSLGNLHATIERSDGKGWREVDLRDARKHGWKPSVTTVGQRNAKDGVTEWRIKEGIRTAIRFAESDSWDDVDAIYSESQKTAQRAAEAGTRIHDGISQFLRGLEPFTLDLAAKAAIDGWIRWYASQSELKLTRSEIPFCSEDWGFGGTVDAVGTYRGRECITDFKTQDAAVAGDFNFYEEYPWQLAAYGLGLEMPDAVLLTCCISRSTPGLVMLKQWDDNQRYLRTFTCDLAAWQYAKGYECGKNVKDAGKMFDFVGVK